MADPTDTPKTRRRKVAPGVRAREIRQSKGLTIAQAARLAHMGTGALCDFENGKRNLRTDSLLRLASSLNIPPSALLDC